MTFQKLAKTHFSQHLVYFSKQYFEISGKKYYHGNDITNTIPPLIFFVQGSLRCKNNILLHFNLQCQCMVSRHFGSSIF